MMSELAITLLRFGFLLLIWAFVFFVVAALRRDLTAPSNGVLAAPLPTGDKPKQKKSRKAKNTARKLVVVEGELNGTVVPLGNSPVTIGRAADSTLVLTDDFASNHHARLYPHDDSWVVEDLGSTNGTWIDRTRLTTPTVLNIDQPLRIGRTVLELRK